MSKKEEQGKGMLIIHKLKRKPTVALIGKFFQGRSPCVQHGEERDWFLESGFTIEHDSFRNIKCKHILINTAMLPKTGLVEKNLVEGETYSVSLKPSEDSMKIIQDENGRFTYFNALSGKEILAITEWPANVKK